jgi:hypothetical protein
MATGTTATPADVTATTYGPTTAPVLTADAPVDGIYYARRNGVWTSITPSGVDAPADGNYYARYNGAWAMVTPASSARIANTALWFTGTTDPPTSIPNAQTGDFYFNTTTGKWFVMS